MISDHHHHHPCARTHYCTSLQPGPQYLRIWQLAFRSDFGLPGLVCPDSFLTLCELVLCFGLLCLRWCLNQNQIHLHRLIVNLRSTKNLATNIELNDMNINKKHYKNIYQNDFVTYLHL